MLFIRSNIVRLCLTFLYWILFTFPAHTQDILDESNKFHVGIAASISASTLSILAQPLPNGNSGSAQVYHKTPMIGYKIGSDVKIGLSSHFFLISGLSFVKTKTKISSSFLLGNSVEKISIGEDYSWIEIPFNANYILNPESSKKIFMGLGLSTRRLLNAKARITATIADITYSGSELSTYSDLNKWNMFGMGNIGVVLPVSDKNKFLITISCERNLSKMVHEINNSDPLFSYSSVHSDFKINSFSINASYLF